MKGHVGDGARSGELKAPGTGLFMPSHTLSFVSITFDSAGIGSLKLMPLRSAILGSCLVGV
jgi:hypothetical protein